MLPLEKETAEEVKKELELKGAEEAFRRLKKAVETVQIGVTITDTEGRILYTNPAEARMHGYTVEDLIGKNVRTFAAPDQLQPMSYDRMKELKSWRRESTNLRKDGTSFPVQLMSDIVTNSEGQAIGIVTTCEDITERKLSEEALQFRFRFEKLISGISSRFINLGPAEVDYEIHHALQDIGEFDDVDRSYVFQFYDHGTRFSNTHEWCRDGIESHRHRLIGLSVHDLPWISERVNRGETIHVPIVADLPPEAGSEKKEFQKERIISITNVPMIVGGTVVGFLGFDSVRKQKTWSEDTIALLRIVGEIFANALERRRIETELRKAKEELEMRVEKRTKQLAEMNQVLEEGIRVRNQEIFERRRAEKALIESEERYRDLFENASDLIQSVAPDGALLFVNRTWREALRDSGKPGTSFFDFVSETDRERVRDLFKRAMDGEAVPKFETELISKDGNKITVEGSINCKFEEERPISIRGIFRDVSHRKEVERMKNEFIATVSHELRTPLTAIHGSLGAIAGGIVGEIPPKPMTLVDIARRNSARLIRMINEFLDVEKMEAGKMEFQTSILDLTPLIEHAMEYNRAYADKYGVKLILDNPLAHVKVDADSDRIIQVLTNLLSNAAKFSPPESKVCVTVAHADGVVRVSVKDEGPGIPDEFRPRVFQKFAQADKTRKTGTGLGLSISKAIIEKLGGHVGFESEPGAGATFWFELPEAEE